MDPITVVVIVVVMLLFVFLMKGKTISASEARSKVSTGALLVDVRSPGEFSGRHIEGAVNIPLDQVESRLGEFGAKNNTIVLYCASGTRSGMAMRKLKKLGYDDVHNLGSIAKWK